MGKGVKVILGTVVAAVVVAAVAIAVAILTRDDAPEAVDLESTVARIEAADDRTEEPADAELTEKPSDTGSTDGYGDDNHDDHDHETEIIESATDAGGTVTTVAPATMDAVAVETDTTTATVDRMAGVWTVEVAENAGDLQREPTVSFAGFRVDEVLGGGIGDFTAVGRTADVSGSIELTDTVLVAATVEVAMSTLRTDNGNRDGQVRRALSTNEFPLATFTLVEPVELPASMADGEAFSESAEGDLTIKGVTNRVTFDLQAQLLGDRIVAVGSSDVTFSDYGVTAPTAPIVVSVEDHGIMEFQLIFTR